MALTIVLLCSGNGSDSSHYRPSRDDVRYRHRHDALVRCVASTLFGAAGSDDHKPCEVVFFYDGDFSCMHMRLARPSTSSTNAPMSPSSIKGRDPPLEKDIVAEWRRASKEAIRQREQHIHERRNECTPSMWMDRTLSSSFSSGTMGNISSVGRDSRRQNMQNQSGRSGEKIEEDLPRLETCCVLDSWKTVSSSSSNTISSNNEKNSFSSASSSDENSGNISKTIKKLPSNMPSSKRDILTALQSICPVDYLRTHHLNVPLDVALRKCNKNKLMVAWEGYRGYLSEKTSATKEDGNIEISVSRKSNNAPKNAVHEDVKLDNKWDEIERTFRSLMTKAKGSASRKGENDEGSKITSEKECSTDVMAAYLHESCDAELPCWGWDFSTAIEKIGNNKENEVQHIFLFLGAVRDMTETENNALSHACNRLRIPLVPCRLGPVPEFTSKIISVAGYHYHRGLLGDGLVGLWKCRRSRERQTETTRSLKMNTVNQALSHKRSLHVIAILPIDSKSLTADPSHRTRVHWCMVRLCVCSLWRSKLASASEAEPSHTALKNVLTFVFNDGKKLTLEQKEFISTMAENHKAAPSERQVLEELCRRRNDIGNVPSGDISFLTNGEESFGMEVFALDFTEFLTSKRHDASSTRSSRQIIDMAYSEDVFANQSLHSKRHGGKSVLLYAIIQIRSGDHGIDNQMAKEVEVHKSITSSLALASIQIRGQRTIIEAQDGEACTVMMLQHLDYQGVLFPLLRLDDDQSNKYLASKDVILSANIQDLRKRRKKQKKDTSSKRQRGNKTIK